MREAVLAACRSHLSSDGIAYVSYTAHPGGHLRRMLREAAQWHARGLDDPWSARSARAALFALLDRSSSPTARRSTAAWSADDLHALATAPEHDARPRPAGSAAYEPVWFTDFAAAACAARDGLRRRRIPESSRRPPWSEGVDAFVDDAAGEDRIAREQYFDLLVLRRFRHSLLCRDERRPAREVDRAAVQRMLVEENGEAARPVRDAARAPRRGRRRARRDAGRRLRRRAGRLPAPCPPRPRGSPASARSRARSLASQARPGAIVTTLENHVVRINDEPTAALLGLLDGTRDRAAIRDAFPGELTEESLEAALAKLAELGCWWRPP